MSISKRTLGRTGISVSEIAFGGVEIGIPYGIGVNDRSDMLSHAEAVKLLHAAIDNGINLFDTARLYGESETIMGKAFKDRRDQVVISTKCRHFRDADGKIFSKTALREAIRSSLEESLAELQTDYVDVFMLHQADMEILSNEDVAEIFMQCKNQGLTRAIGASTYTVDETKKTIDAGVWDVVQLPFNLMDQRQETTFDEAKEKKIALVVRSVLMKGILSNKGTKLHPALSSVEQHINSYQSLLTPEASDLSTLATKFVLSYNEVASVLVGIDKQEYLYKSLQAADGNYLDDHKKKKAKALMYPDPSFLDLPRWDRMGWLK